MAATTHKTGPIGRLARLIVAIYLVVIDVPVLLEGERAYNMRVLGLVVAMTVFYLLVHLLVGRFLPHLNRWLGAVVAIVPIFLLWFYGQGAGPLFGQGEGGTAAITYVAVSLLVDVLRSDSGCEVMALPSLMLGKRTHLPCLAFGPIDALESKGQGEISEKDV